MSKQLMLALGAGGAAAAAVGASAASIGTVNSTDLGAGTTVVAECDSSIDVSYTTAFVADQYDVSTVTLSGIDDVACATQAIKVTVLAADGADVDTDPDVLTELTGSVTGTSVGLAVTPSVPAADVTGLALVISG